MVGMNITDAAPSTAGSGGDVVATDKRLQWLEARLAASFRAPITLLLAPPSSLSAASPSHRGGGGSRASTGLLTNSPALRNQSVNTFHAGGSGGGDGSLMASPAALLSAAIATTPSLLIDTRAVFEHDEVRRDVTAFLDSDSIRTLYAFVVYYGTSGAAGGNNNATMSGGGASPSSAVAGTSGGVGAAGLSGPLSLILTANPTASELSLNGGIMRYAADAARCSGADAYLNAGEAFHVHHIITNKILVIKKKKGVGIITADRVQSDVYCLEMPPAMFAGLHAHIKDVLRPLVASRVAAGCVLSSTDDAAPPSILVVPGTAAKPSPQSANATVPSGDASLPLRKHILTLLTTMANAAQLGHGAQHGLTVLPLPMQQHRNPAVEIGSPAQQNTREVERLAAMWIAQMAGAMSRAAPVPLPPAQLAEELKRQSARTQRMLARGGAAHTATAVGSEDMHLQEADPQDKPLHGTGYEGGNAGGGGGGAGTDAAASVAMAEKNLLGSTAAATWGESTVNAQSRMSFNLGGGGGPFSGGAVANGGAGDTSDLDLGPIPPNIMPLGVISPAEEGLHWLLHERDMSFLVEAIHGPLFIRCLGLLRENNSTYSENLESHCLQIQDHLDFVRITNHWLRPILPYFNRVTPRHPSRLSPAELGQSPFFSELMQLLYLMWEHNDKYPTTARMASMIAGLCENVIALSMEHLDLRDEESFNDSKDVRRRIENVFACAANFKRAVHMFRTKATALNRASIVSNKEPPQQQQQFHKPHPPSSPDLADAMAQPLSANRRPLNITVTSGTKIWNVSPMLLFAHLDQFLERLNDILAILDMQDLFQSIAADDVSGVEGNALHDEMARLSETFTAELRVGFIQDHALVALPHPGAKFDSLAKGHVLTFGNQLEVRMADLALAYIESAPLTVTLAQQILSFLRLLERPSCQGQLTRIVTSVSRRWMEDVRGIQNVFAAAVSMQPVSATAISPHQTPFVAFHAGGGGGDDDNHSVASLQPGSSGGTRGPIILGDTLAQTVLFALALCRRLCELNGVIRKLLERPAVIAVTAVHTDLPAEAVGLYETVAYRAGSVLEEAFQVWSRGLPHVVALLNSPLACQDRTTKEWTTVLDLALVSAAREASVVHTTLQQPNVVSMLASMQVALVMPPEVAQLMRLREKLWDRHTALLDNIDALNALRSSLQPHEWALVIDDMNDMEEHMRKGTRSLTWASGEEIDQYNTACAGAISDLRSGVTAMRAHVEALSVILEELQAPEHHIVPLSSARIGDRTMELLDLQSRFQDVEEKRTAVADRAHAVLLTISEKALRTINEFRTKSVFTNKAIVSLTDPSWVRFMQYVNKLVQDRALEFVRRCLESLAKQLDSEYVRKSNDGMPLVEARLEVDRQDGVRVVPDLHTEIHLILLQIKESPQQLVLRLPVSDEQKRALGEALEEDVAVFASNNQINKALDDTWAGVTHILNTLNQFEPLYTPTMTRNVERELHSGDAPVYKLPLEDVHGQIKRYQLLGHRVGEIHNIRIVHGWLRLDCRGAKTGLRANARTCLDMCVGHIRTSIQDTLANIAAFCQKADVSLDSDLNTLDTDDSNEVKKLFSLIQSVRKADTNTQATFLPMMRGLRLLTSLCAIPKQEAEILGDEIEQREPQWSQTVAKAVGVREQLSGVYDREVQMLKDRIRVFQEETVEQQREAFLRSPLCTSTTILEDPYSLMDAEWKTWKTIRSRADELLGEQDLYDLSVSDFSMVTETMDQVQKSKALWDAAVVATMHTQSWLTKVFQEVDTGVLIDETRVIHRYFTSSLPREVKAWTACAAAERRLGKIINSIPLIQDLRAGSLRPRHWTALMKLCDVRVEIDPTSPTTTLGELLGLNLHRHSDEVAKLVTRADKELQIELALDKIDQIWSSASLPSQITEHKRISRGNAADSTQVGATSAFYVYLGSVDEIQEMVEDHLNQLQAMQLSRWGDFFKERSAATHRALALVSKCLTLWVDCQRSWDRLFPIFTLSEDLRAALVDDTKAFDCLHGRLTFFFDLVFSKGASSKKNKGTYASQIIPLCSGALPIVPPSAHELRTLHAGSDRLHEEVIPSTGGGGGDSASPLQQELELLLEVLVRCEANLASYLESKRIAFPRLFFVSDADLTDILAHAQSPPYVCRYINKVCQAIERVVFIDESDEDSNVIVSVFSVEGEELMLPQHFMCEGKVEVWLEALIRAVQVAVRVAVILANAAYIETPRTRWMFQHIAQAVLLVSRVHWTGESTVALEAVEDGNASALVDHANYLHAQLTATIETVSKDLSPAMRKTLVSLITIDVHARDVILELIEKRVDSTTSFSWLKVLRFYFENPAAHVALAAPFMQQMLLRSQNNALHAISSAQSGLAADFSNILLTQTVAEGDLSASLAQITSTENLCSAQICDVTLTHGFEYIGNCGCLVVTPLTDRCYITLTQALKLYKGGAPAGPAGTGKTETVKDIAHALGIPVYVFNCSEQMDYLTIGAIFKGLAMSGAWGCFDEFNRIAIEVLSVVAAQVRAVLDAVRRKDDTFTMLGKQLKLHRSVGLFITMNPGYKGRTELPENVKALFRPCAMVAPDIGNICEVMLSAEGFVYSKELAAKFVRVYQLNAQLLSPQLHYDWGLRAIRAVLLIAGSLKRSHPQSDERSILLAALRDANLAKLARNDVSMFGRLLTAIFPNIRDAKVRDASLEAAIRASTVRLNYSLGENAAVSGKLLQFFDLCNVRHSLFVLGSAGTGKSALLRIAKGALEAKLHAPVTIEAFDPKAISSYDLYGYVSPQTREWKDGILSSIFRNFSSNPMYRTGAQWIVLDGAIDADWIESMNSVMDDNKLLTLANNERIVMTATMRLIFEIVDLQNATLATVSRAGILFLAENDVGWVAMKERWISTEAPEKFRTHLDVLFDKHLQIFLNYAAQNTKNIVHMSQYAYIKSLFSLLEATLNPKISPFAHVTMTGGDLTELVFLWCCVMVFGGTIQYPVGVIDHRLAFSQFVRREFGQMMRLPEEGSAFDWCLSPTTDHESIVWKRWLDVLSLKESLLEYDPAFHDPLLQSGLGGTFDATQAAGIASGTANNFRGGSGGGGEDGSMSSYTRRQRHPLFHFDPAVPLHQFVLPTTDTERHAYVLNLLARSGKHVLLAGGAGSGKSSLVRYLQRRAWETAQLFDASLQSGSAAAQAEYQKVIATHQHAGSMLYLSTDDYQFSSLPLDGHSDSVIFQRRIEEQLEKRTGRQYGPASRKRLVVIVENLNMPLPDKYGSQSALALMRQHMDRGFWFDQAKLHPKDILETQYIASMNPNVGSQTIPRRLQTALFVIGLGTPTACDEELSGALTTALRLWLRGRHASKPVTEALVDSVGPLFELWRQIQKRFLPTADTFHYAFTLGDVAKTLQGLAAVDEKTPIHTVPMLWLSSIRAVFCDRLAHLQDHLEALAMARAKATNIFGSFLNAANVDMTGETTPAVLFEGLVDDADGSYPPIPPFASPIHSREEALSILRKRAAGENISIGHIIFFDEALDNVLKLSRTLALPGGNALLIGVGGSGRRTLASLAAQLCRFKLNAVRMSSQTPLMEINQQFAAMVHECVVKKERHVLLIADADEPSSHAMSLVAEFLATRSLDRVLDADIKEQIQTRMSNELRIQGDTQFNDGIVCHERYLRTLSLNLRVVVMLNPTLDTLRFYARRFPTLLSRTQIMFFHDWPHDALLKVANGAITARNSSNSNNHTREQPPEAIDFSTATQSNVRISKEAQQLLLDETATAHADVAASVAQLVRSPADALQRAICFHLASVHGLARTFYETLKAQHQKHAFVTPKTFLTFVETALDIILKRRNQFVTRRERLSGGLEQLRRCGDQINVLKGELHEFKRAVEEKALTTDMLLERVSVERGIVADQNTLAVREQEKTNRIVDEVNALVADCEADLKAAEPIVVAARAALNTLDKNNLTELKSLGKPPTDVHDVTACVMCLLSKPDRIPRDRSWAAARRMMTDITRWKKQMEDLDYSNIPQPCIDAIWKTVHAPHFDPEAIKSKSFAASSLCRWVVNTVKFHQVRVMVRPKEERLAEAQTRLGFSKTQLAKVQKKVQTLQAKLATLEEQYDAAMAERRVLEEQLENTSLKLQRAQRLLTSLRGERVRWDASLKVLGPTQAVLDGDSLVAASFVIYAGPLPAELRDAFMSQVRGLLKKNPHYTIAFTEVVERRIPGTGKKKSPSIAKETSIANEEKTTSEKKSSNAQDDEAVANAEEDDDGPTEKKEKEEEKHEEDDDDDDEERVFEDPTAVDALYTPVEVARWSAEHLASAKHMTENAAVSLATPMWPLVIDPQGQGLRWIRGRSAALATAERAGGATSEAEKKDPSSATPNHQQSQRSLVTVRNDHPELVSTVLAAAARGDICVVDNIGADGIAAALQPLLERQRILSEGVVIVGDREASVSKDFFLFLRSPEPTPLFTPEIFARCTVVDFTVTEVGLHELLLSAVVQAEQPDLERDRVDLTRGMNAMTISLLECENTLLEQLSTAHGDILQNETLVRTLESAKTQSIAMRASLRDAVITKIRLKAALDLYAPIASRGALTYVVVSELNKIERVYSYAIDAFIDQYCRAIVRAQHTAAALVGAQRVDWIVLAVTRGIFAYVSRSLFTRHRIVLAASIAFIVAVRAGTLPTPYVNFFLRGHKKVTEPIPPLAAEWLSVGQWEMLAALADVQPSMTAASSSTTTTAPSTDHGNTLGGGGGGPVVPLSLLREECAETVRWRLWCEHVTPETEHMPGDWKQLSTFEKAMIIRCLRPDRATAAISQYIKETLGSFLFEDYAIPLTQALQETPNTSPILFILSPGSDPSRAVDAAAATFGVSDRRGELTHISLGQGQERGAEVALREASAKGHWLMLHNVHLMRTWAHRLEVMIDALQQQAQQAPGSTAATPATDASSSPEKSSDRKESGQSLHPRFRLFLSAEPADHLPLCLLQGATKLVDEPPSGLRANMTRAYQLYASEPWEQSTRPQEYHTLVYCLCFFHAVVVERKKFGPAGWNRSYPFNAEDLLACTDVLTGYLEDRPRVPWEDLQYVFGQILYGGHVTDAWDSRLLMAYLTQLVSADTVDGSHIGGGEGIPLPTSRSHAETLAILSEALADDHSSSRLFFMNPLTENRARAVEGTAVFQHLLHVLPQNITTLQHAASSSSAQPSDQMIATDQLSQLALLLGAVPETISLSDIHERLSDDLTPFQHVFAQECERMNRLTATMRDALDEADAAIRGLVAMTAAIESLLADVRNDRVPEAWRALWGPTKRPLASWTALVADGYAQLSSWAADLMAPNAVNISVLFNPVAFLTALQQEGALRSHAELDAMVIIVEVTKKVPSQIDQHARDGCFVYGPALEGAAWDSQSNALSEAATKDGAPIPVLIIRAVHASKLAPQHAFEHYDCPVYTTSDRGSTFVASLPLRTRVPPSVWSLRGTALILDGAY